MLCQQLAQCICIYFFCILIALSVIIKKQFPAMQGPFMVRMNGKCCSVAFHCCTAPSPTLPSAAPGNSWKRKGEQQQPELRPSLEVRSHLGRFSLHAWKQTAVAAPSSPEPFFLLLYPAMSLLAAALGATEPGCHSCSGLLEPPLCPCREMCAPVHSSRNSARPRAGQNHCCCLPTPAPGSEVTLSHGLLVTYVYF